MFRNSPKVDGGGTACLGPTTIIEMTISMSQSSSDATLDDSWVLAGPIRKYNRCRKRPAFYCWCMENILALPQSKDVGDIQICKKATLALRKKLLSFVRKCRDHSNLQGGNFNIKKQTFFWQLHWSVKDKIIIGINSPSKQNQNPSDKELQWYTNAESIFKDNISILGLKFFIGFFSNLSDVFWPFVNRIFQKQILMPTSNKLMISNLLLQRETNMYCSKQYRFL